MLRFALFVVLLALVVVSVPGWAQEDTCEGAFCAQCRLDGNFTCAFDQKDGGCECNLINDGIWRGCSVDGHCTYQAAGPGPGGLDNSCYIVPGEFCPVACPHCVVVYWY